MDHLDDTFERKGERAGCEQEGMRMADEEGTPQGDCESHEKPQQVEIHMELRDTLPGGRAVAAVESDGEIVWLASKEHISEQARDELLEVFTLIVSADLGR